MKTRSAHPGSAACERYAHAPQGEHGCWAGAHRCVLETGTDAREIILVVLILMECGEPLSTARGFDRERKSLVRPCESHAEMLHWNEALSRRGTPA